MALFECCSKQFVKDTGRTTLQAVKDLNSSSRCKILCVVTRKKSRWFWKPIKYSPTPFTLNELLTKPIDTCSLDLKSSVLIAKYKNEPQFHVKGKLGSKIASEFGIDVSAIESFTVGMDIGTVKKMEVGWQELKNALKETTLNLDHEYVQYILSKQRRGICVINETVVTCGPDTDLSADSQEEGDASIDAGKPKFSINLSGSVQETHHRSFELPSNTVLAFACYELMFESVMGTLDLVLDDMTDGPPDKDAKRHAFDEPDGQKDKALQAVFDEILKSPQYSQITGCFRKLMSFPESIGPLRDLLEEALSSSEGEKPESSSVVDFKTKTGNGFESCKALLNLVGFKLEQEIENIAFPEKDFTGLLTCCTGLSEALVELSAPQCQALQQVTSEYLEPLLYVLKNTMYGRSTLVDDPSLGRIWTHSSNPAKQFLQSLGFEQLTEGDRNVLDLKSEFDGTFLEDCYVSVFVLCAA